MVICKLLEFFLFSFVNVPMVYFTTEFLVRIFYYYGKMLISTCVIGDCQLYLMHMFESQIIKSVAEYVPVNGYKYSLVLLLKRLNGFWSNIVSTILHFLFVSLLPHMILWLSPIYLKCFGNSFIKLSFLLDYMQSGQIFIFLCRLPFIAISCIFLFHFLFTIWDIVVNEY